MMKDFSNIELKAFQHFINIYDPQDKLTVEQQVKAFYKMKNEFPVLDNDLIHLHMQITPDSEDCTQELNDLTEEVGLNKILTFGDSLGLDYSVNLKLGDLIPKERPELLKLLDFL